MSCQSCLPFPFYFPPHPTLPPAILMSPTSGKAELGFDPQPVVRVPEQLSQAEGGGAQECWG